MAMKEIKERMKNGKLDVYKGKPKLWSVLDESYSAEQKKAMQMNINDARIAKSLDADSMTLRKRGEEGESDLEEDVIRMPIKTKYYD